MYYTKSQKGFTLIELLVVIAIIGILSSVVLASLNDARRKSRDARRVSDIKQLQLALEFYFDANRSYPNALTVAGLVTPGYMAQIPTDPTSIAGNYRYAALNAGCTSYHLGAQLEDPTHVVLSSDIDAAAGTAGTGCLGPASGNSAADFSGADTASVGIYDVKP